MQKPKAPPTYPDIYIKFDYIRDTADSLRKRCSKNNAGIPVDIDEIIEFGLGLEIRPVPYLKSSHDIEGMLSNDLKTIFVDNEMFLNLGYEPRMRFTLAHEVGHLMLHSEYYKKQQFHSPDDWLQLLQEMPPDTIDWYERQADEFAGRLLVPADYLLSELPKLKTDVQTLITKGKDAGFGGEELTERVKGWIGARLAKKFNVSPKVIEIRLRKEKIPLREYFGEF
jgi:hypothetical protein